MICRQATRGLAAFSGYDGTSFDGHHSSKGIQVRLASGPAVDELLDHAAIKTLRQGGAVKVLPKAEIPRGSAMAAILRFAS